MAATAEPTQSFEEDAKSNAEGNNTLTTDAGAGRGKELAHHSQMLAVKDERKRAEYDVQLLANRLAYLRAEERAAAKKVAETKKRTSDIAAAKRNSRHHDKVREDYKLQLKAKEEANREYFRESRRQHKNSLKEAQDAIKETHRASALEAKRQSELLQKQKQDMSKGDNARRLESHKNIRLAHERQRAKQAKRSSEKEAALRKTYEDKVTSEQKRKDEAVKLIAQFEAEEARLISRLKMTQVEQFGALTKLEKTLLSP